uniref:hypothetical protein n=1 Tax=Streptomyces anulatus TaxID=1892 RepID=UPI002F93464E|nr:hypothetical protein OH765_39975 [Streptomyces anulatus]
MTTGSHDGTRPRINGHPVTVRSEEPKSSPRTSRKALLAAGGIMTLLVAALAFTGRGAGDDQADPLPADNPQAGILSAEPARSTHGAQRAAAAIASGLGSERMFSPEARHTLIRRVAHPAAEERLQAGFDRDYSPAFNAKIGLDPEGRAPEGAEFVSRTMPAGTAVRDYDEDQTVVDVWAAGLFGLTGTGRDAPKTSWLTMAVHLKWTSAGWRMTELTQTKGPAPADDIVGQAPPL